MRRKLAVKVKANTEPAQIPAPQLLLVAEAPHKVFLRNLRDLISAPKQPKLRLTTWPAKFWPDVFVERPLPWRSLGQSYAGHVVAIAAVLGMFQLWPSRSRVIPAAVFSSRDVVYYDAAEYLPPLNTGVAKKRTVRKGDPVKSAQPIISVPPEADNHTQTVVTPPKIQLRREVPLPNVVSWADASMPVSASPHPSAELKLPRLTTDVVAPAPDVSLDRMKRSAHLDSAVVAPAPDVSFSGSRRTGDLNIARSEPVAPAPKVSLQEQSTRRGQPSLGSVAAVPPPPSLPGAAGTSGSRMIALGIHPLAPSTKVESPAGNRRGSFAATPDGKPGASGAPESTTGKTASSNAAGSKSDGLPSGLQVGAGPKSSTSASQIVADARPPRAEPAPSFDNPSELDRQVFGGRRSYAMTINMPNLNSSGGSWVIHFAELKEDGKGELSAPVAEHEVDPGYPTELMRQNIGGTVTLRAVIFSDGSVGEVRVLRGVDDRLDDYARSALARWHFRPATKNGSAVPLEAVVMIPFRPVRSRPSF